MGGSQIIGESILTEEAQLAEAEANYLEGISKMLQQRAKDIREVGQQIAKEEQANSLQASLEGLPFRVAASGKCDWVPVDMVNPKVLPLFDQNGDYRSEVWHYKLMKDGNILRFPRKQEKMEDG